MFLEYFESFTKLVQSQDFFTASILLILGKALSGIFFIPGTPLTLLSGIVLGTFWGTVVAIVGNSIGAVLAFLLARYILRDFVQNKLISKYPTIKEYENKFFKNGFYTVIFLRLVPLFPFNALNFLLGVSQVKFRDYFWGTVIGIIPGTMAFVYLGESFAMLSWVNILVAVVGIVGLASLPKFWKLK